MDSDAKMKMSEIYSLCNKLFSKEFAQVFAASREEFRDWLNEKTSLDCNHMSDKHESLDAWIFRLREMARDRKLC